MSTRLKSFWEYLKGHEDEFGMEARVFHSISIITLGLLLVMVLINVVISIHLLAIFAGIAVLLQFLLFYLARFLGKLKLSVLLYAVIGYLLLFGNYYYNSGKAGPTIFGFFLTLHLLVTISQKKYHVLWLVTHILVVFFLLLSEYFHPEWVPFTYQSAADQVLDLGFSYTVSLVAIFYVTTFLRGSYTSAKTRAEQRAQELLKQNEYLEMLDAERNKLFSIISHDLRGPLSNIESLLAIQDSGRLSDEEKLFVKKELLRSAGNTREMLENLLAWSKAQREDIAVQLETVYLCMLMEETASLFNTIVKQKEIQLKVELQRELPVLGDATWLKTILRNLIGNAMKFTPVGGRVLVNGRVENSEVVVSIKDTGQGIPAAVQPLIFTPGVYSLEGTGNEKGAGLGLLICKDLVEKQGGKIWFETSEGEGTTFFFSLKQAQQIEKLTHQNT